MARPVKDSDGPAMKRVQMDLAPAAVARLQRLQQRLEAASYAETVRRALHIHEALLDLIGPDGRLLVGRDGVTTPIHLIGLEA